MSTLQSPVEQALADFARSRMSVAIPPTLTADIQRAVAAAPRPQVARSSPVFAATALAAVVAVIAVLLAIVTAPRAIGPDPGETAPPTPTARPTLTPDGELTLVAPGDTVRIPAIDSQGRYGTITVERGEEVGEYAGNETPVAWDTYFVELYITYELDRAPDQPYGAGDWAWFEETPDDTKAYFGGTTIEGPGTPEPGLPEVTRGSDDIEGWLIMGLPADTSDTPMWLAYMGRPEQQPQPSPGEPLPTPEPGNEVRALSEMLLREPGPPVGITPVWTPPAGFEPPPMPDPPPHDEADALFAETLTCTSADLRYEIEYPATWFTDTACTQFSPAPLDAAASAAPIRIELRDGFFDPDAGLIWDIGEMTIVPPGGGGYVDGGQAFFMQWEATGEGALVPVGERVLEFEIFAGYGAPDPDDPWWFATTTSVDAPSEEAYELNMAVLHRMVRTMTLAEQN